VKKRLDLHNLHTDHIMIQSELKYLIGGKVVMLKCPVLCGNPLQRFGSGLEPDPEPNQEFGPLGNTRCIQEHVRMLWQSLTALCKASGGAGSIWKYLEAVVRGTGVSVRFAYGFRTEFHFADVTLI